MKNRRNSSYRKELKQKMLNQIPDSPDKQKLKHKWDEVDKRYEHKEELDPSFILAIALTATIVVVAGFWAVTIIFGLNH